MTDGVAAGLRSAIEAAAEGLAGVERIDDGGSVELRRGGGAFVRVGPAGASFRLGAGIASAARRTPGAAPSSAGPDWVDFRPASLDRFALDRATSWTELAWRLAEPGH